MAELCSPNCISFLEETYIKKLITTNCLCPAKKIFVIRHLLSNQECDNIIKWMNTVGEGNTKEKEHRYEELGGKNGGPDAR